MVLYGALWVEHRNMGFVDQQVGPLWLITNWMHMVCFLMAENIQEQQVWNVEFDVPLRHLSGKY